MLAHELLKTAEEALKVVQGERPHQGELLQLAMYLHRAWEEGLDYAYQEAVLQSLTALRGALRNRDLSHLNLAAGEGVRFEYLLNRAIRAIEFARKLATLRETRGLSARDLAARAGVNNSLIYKLQRAIHAPPSPYTLARLAAGLGVTPEELGTPSFPVRSPGQPLPTPSSGSYVSETPVDSAGPGCDLVAAVSGYLDRLLRESYLVLKLRHLDAEVRTLIEAFTAKLTSDDPDTRELRMRVLRKVMDAPGSVLRIVDGWLGDEPNSEASAGARPEQADAAAKQNQRSPGKRSRRP